MRINVDQFQRLVVIGLDLDVVFVEPHISFTQANGSVENDVAYYA